MGSEILDRLDAAVQELAALPWDALGDDEVVEVLRRVETVKRRLAPVDHAAINQVQARSIPFTNGCRTTTVFLSNLLRIGRGEATARAQAAEALGVRRTITGALVGPRFPLVAAAQTEGVLSERHAAVITRRVDSLPDEVADRSGDWLEATLVEHGRHLDPAVLDRHARQLAYRLDQDGVYDEQAYRDKTRSFDLHRRTDGSAHLDAELTAECAEYLATALDAVTKPTPSSEAGPDPRTATQRRHDGFAQLLTLALRASVLPRAGGISTTVLLTMDADTWITGQGAATTGHGYTLSAHTAQRWAGHDTRLILTLLDKTRAVTAYSTGHRIFTETQRLAIIARDKGCTFPGCDATPQWCEINHVPPWQTSHRTTVTEGALTCAGDHRDHQAMGWQPTMLDGIPHWIPPKWLDPDQRPIRNTRHDPPP
jgi:hypothetical protein